MHIQDENQFNQYFNIETEKRGYGKGNWVKNNFDCHCKTKEIAKGREIWLLQRQVGLLLSRTAEGSLKCMEPGNSPDTSTTMVRGQVFRIIA